MIKLGIVNQLIDSIESVMDYIPAPERTHLCIITYNNYINFYTQNKENSSGVQVKFLES